MKSALHWTSNFWKNFKYRYYVALNLSGTFFKKALHVTLDISGRIFHLNTSGKIAKERRKSTSPSEWSTVNCQVT